MPTSGAAAPILAKNLTCQDGSTMALAIKKLAMWEVDKLRLSLQAKWVYVLITSQINDGQIFPGQSLPFRFGKRTTKAERRPWFIEVPAAADIAREIRWPPSTVQRCIDEISRVQS